MVKITKDEMSELIAKLSTLLEQLEVSRVECELIERMRVGALYLHSAIDKKIGVGLLLIDTN